MDMRGNGRTIVAGLGIVLALAGAGCLSSSTTALTVGSGSALTLRETVLGIGGKIAELFGAGAEPQEVVLGDRDATLDAALAWKKADDWQTGSMVLDVTSSRLVLSNAQYDGLVTNGSATLSLGLLDETLSGALEWTETVSAFLASVNQPVPDLPSAADIQTIAVDALDATAWVRVDGALRNVEAIKASNWLAEYVILKSSDSPLILSVTLKPTADASFQSAMRGFEVSEIKTTSP